MSRDRNQPNNCFSIHLQFTRQTTSPSTTTTFTIAPSLHMMIMDYISMPIFLVSFAIGIFFVYIWGADIKTVVVYPTPENAGKIQYQDRANHCFKYKTVEVDCPEDKSLISRVPMQD